MEFKICKIDVDAHMDFAAKYNVASIPTLLVFKNCELVNRQTGFSSKADVVDLLIINGTTFVVPFMLFCPIIF